MFNYQHNLYLHFKELYDNYSAGEIYTIANDYFAHTRSIINDTSTQLKAGITKYVQDSPAIQLSYLEWLKYYSEAYEWIHPKIIELTR